MKLREIKLNRTEWIRSWNKNETKNDKHVCNKHNFQEIKRTEYSSKIALIDGISCLGLKYQTKLEVSYSRHLIMELYLPTSILSLYFFASGKVFDILRVFRTDHNQ